MIYFLFDLDDTLIIHDHGRHLNYEMIQPDYRLNNLLSRIREIAVQANSSTLTSGDRTSLQTEVDAYLSEINNITKSIKFNDLKLGLVGICKV